MSRKNKKTKKEQEIPIWENKYGWICSKCGRAWFNEKGECPWCSQWKWHQPKPAIRGKV